jgi:hypothetical protein
MPNIKHCGSSTECLALDVSVAKEFAISFSRTCAEGVYGLRMGSGGRTLMLCWVKSRPRVSGHGGCDLSLLELSSFVDSRDGKTWSEGSQPNSLGAREENAAILPAFTSITSTMITGDQKECCLCTRESIELSRKDRE